MILFPLLMSQHGEAVQYAAGAETKICRFLWGEGEEGESSQPHDENDGFGGRILIKTNTDYELSVHFFIFTIMMWPEGKLGMELTQHSSMLIFGHRSKWWQIKEKDSITLWVRHFTSLSLKNNFIPLHPVDEQFFSFFVCFVKKKKKSSLLYCLARCVVIFSSNKST